MPNSKLPRAIMLLPVLLALAACRPAAGATPTADPAAPTGQFDCSGHEGGLIAYAGRFTFAAGGAVSFEDFDGGQHAGTYTYDAGEQTFTFSSFVFDYAEYFSDDSLTAALAADASLPHVELGEVDCERAVPGETGPP